MLDLLRERMIWRPVARWRRRSPAPRGATVQGRLLAITTAAVAPVVLFASAVALQHAYGAEGFLHVASWTAAATLPVIAGAAAVLIVSIAAEALIVRWLIYLERLARAYSRGRYSLRPLQLEKAPAEFRAVGLAVSDMAAAVEDRDSALRAALEEQSVLLREVHHRVKNNLQIVGSLLSLQASRSPEPAVKIALAEALVRIDAMGLSQRFMQPVESEDQISAGELFTAFGVQVRARLGGSPRRMQLSFDIEDMTLGLELGSRLILIAAEGLLQAYRRPVPEPLRCLVSLRREGDNQLLLRISSLDDPGSFGAPDGAISSSLIDGYVRQVRGSRAAGQPAGSLGVLVPLG